MPYPHTGVPSEDCDQVMTGLNSGGRTAQRGQIMASGHSALLAWGPSYIHPFPLFQIRESHKQERVLDSSRDQLAQWMHGSQAQPPSCCDGRQECASGDPGPCLVSCWTIRCPSIVMAAPVRLLLLLSHLSCVRLSATPQMTIISTTAGRNPSEEME